MLTGMSNEPTTRDRLVTAATRLFRQRGYDGTGLAEILAEAGVPKGSLYHHFPEGKADLACAAADWTASEIIRVIDDSFRTAPDWRQGVTTFCYKMAKLFDILNSADGLPAFGIVAAVMGVVNVMGSVGEPPAILGGKIGAALVGTFVGILLAYGFVGPLATLLGQKLEEATKELQCVKVTLLASLQGYAPSLAIEFGRKVLFSTERPSFLELEGHVKPKRA